MAESLSVSESAVAKYANAIPSKLGLSEELRCIGGCGGARLPSRIAFTLALGSLDRVLESLESASESGTTRSDTSETDPGLSRLVAIKATEVK